MKAIKAIESKHHLRGKYRMWDSTVRGKPVIERHIAEGEPDGKTFEGEQIKEGRVSLVADHEGKIMVFKF